MDAIELVFAFMADFTELPCITFNEKVFSAVTHGRTGMAKLRGV